MNIRPVKWIDEVLEIALERLPELKTGAKGKGKKAKASKEVSDSATQKPVTTH